MTFLDLRTPGYALLSGTGAEIGGFEHPAKLPNADHVIRCDRLTRAEAIQTFSEVDPKVLPEVDLVVDLDTDGLRPFAGNTLDFVVCCHVLEHLKDPIKAIAEIFRVIRPGGLAALAVPDKRFTFDRNRPLTPWDKLKAIYAEGNAHPCSSDYLDIVRYIEPQMFQVSAAEREDYLKHLLSRREHLNIWDSVAFSEFLDCVRLLLRLPMPIRYESSGDQNLFEHFVVLEKTIQ